MLQCYQHFMHFIVLIRISRFTYIYPSYDPNTDPNVSNSTMQRIKVLGGMTQNGTQKGCPGQSFTWCFERKQTKQYESVGSIIPPNRG